MTPTGRSKLIFLHGIGTDASSWQLQLEHFATAYSCHAWNLPGYGGTPQRPYTHLSELPELLATAHPDLEQEPAHWVGHSLGGMLALELVAQRPEWVRSLTLVATSPAFGKAEGTWQQRFLEERLAPLRAGQTLKDLAPQALARMLGPQPDPIGKALALRSMGQVPEEPYTQALLALTRFDQRALLSQITVPTLLLAGAHDTNAPAPVMQRMAGKIPHARFVCLEDVGHLIPLEAPQRFNQELQHFLEALP